jgi:uncharacterized protein YfaS (alpha-2-macroglobulin family)
MTVNIANSHLNELGEAISQLLHYPYGCVEQTGSSLLPWIVSRDLPALLPLLHRGTNEIETAIQTGIARLFSMQTRSGGLGYWPGAREPMLWASAYGGLVLALAQHHGVEVPTSEFADLTKYLSEQLRFLGGNDADLSDFPLALYALALAGRPERAYCEKLYDLREKLSLENRALLALALAQSGGPAKMSHDLLSPKSNRRPYDYGDFGCRAREQAVRLLACIACSRFNAPVGSQTPVTKPVANATQDDQLAIDNLEADLMHEQRHGHWDTTQGDAWAVLALTEYSRTVDITLRETQGELAWQGKSVSFHLDKATNCFSLTLPLANTEDAPLILHNSSGTRLFTRVTLEARTPVAQQPRQDRGFSLQRAYERLDDDNHPWPLLETAAQSQPAASIRPIPLRVGDRVLVTLRLSLREPARYVAVDDALPSILEVVNSEFKTQAARGDSSEGGYWMADFHELRKDRYLSFANYLPTGNYTMRYIARVRAAGQVTAPSAKVEEMYHPDRYGLSETQPLASEPLN